MMDRPDPIDIAAIVDRLCPGAPGAADYSRAMRALTACVGLVAGDLPDVGGNALAAARRHWLEGEPNETALVEARIACWSYLDVKNGNSTTIADREDHAVRALIACLFPQARPGDDLDETVDFTLSLLQDLNVNRRAVEEAVSRA